MLTALLGRKLAFILPGMSVCCSGFRTKRSFGLSMLPLHDASLLAVLFVDAWDQTLRVGEVLLTSEQLIS